MLDKVKAWQTRPWEERRFPVVYIDAIYMTVRDGQVTTRAFWVAVGVTVGGHRDILGVWAGDRRRRRQVLAVGY